MILIVTGNNISTNHELVKDLVTTKSVLQYRFLPENKYLLDIIR